MFCSPRNTLGPKHEVHQFIFHLPEINSGENSGSSFFFFPFPILNKLPTSHTLLGVLLFFSLSPTFWTYSFSEEACHCQGLFSWSVFNFSPLFPINHNLEVHNAPFFINGKSELFCYLIILGFLLHCKKIFRRK